MSRLLPALLFLLSTSAAAESFVLSSADWSAPRSGETLVRLPALAGTLRAFEREPDGVIVIGHATGEAGELWAEELRSWLIAFGVASTRVRFDARPELNGVLALDVRRRDSL